MGRPISYLKAVVICHGKSEKQICDFIKSNLRIKIESHSDKHGGKCIQITSVMKTLNSMIFKSFNNFVKIYDDVEICYNKKKKCLSSNFKIFIIMDTDDCTPLQKEYFINKQMFKDHWAYSYIVPIYNNKNLEDVLVTSNIKFEKKGSERKKEYIKIFPTDDKYLKKDSLQLQEFCEQLINNDRTNMDEFIKFCLDCCV